VWDLIQNRHKNYYSAAYSGREGLRKKLLRRLVWKAPVILLLVSFAVWWELKKEQQPSTDKIQAASNYAAAFTGSWVGEVSYPWDAKYAEPFLFQAEGDKLFGSASFLGVKRGIEEGKIQGNSISFLVRFGEYSGGATKQHTNYYWGKLNGNEILLRMQDDRGNAPVEWVLTKNKPTG
jgi:hypothetical protein